MILKHKPLTFKGFIRTFFERFFEVPLTSSKKDLELLRILFANDISLIIKIEMFILLIPLAEYFDFNGLHYNIMSVFSTQSRDYGVFFCPNAASPPCVYEYKIISGGLLTVLS